MTLAQCTHGDIVSIPRVGEGQWRLMIKQRHGWFCRLREGDAWSRTHRFFYNHDEVEMVEEQRSKGTNDKGKSVDPFMGQRGEFKLVGE